MGITSHAFSGEEHAKDLMSTEIGRELMAHAEAWRRAPENRVLCQVYGDPFGGWAIGEVAALSDLIYHGRKGQIEIIGVDAGAAPLRDAKRAENRAVLTNLPLDITAEVYDSHHGGSDADGHLSIPAGLCAVDLLESGVSSEPADAWEDIPLEIGYTDASRTLAHIWESGAVARWPYGSGTIYVLTTRPRYCLTPFMT